MSEEIKAHVVIPVFSVIIILILAIGVRTFMIS
jgi:hypothetical protein